MLLIDLDHTMWYDWGSIVWHLLGSRWGTGRERGRRRSRGRDRDRGRHKDRDKDYDRIERICLCIGRNQEPHEERMYGDRNGRKRSEWSGSSVRCGWYQNPLCSV
jgi:hypothetical protein